MKIGKTIRISVALISVICALCLCGCSVKFGTKPKDSDIVAKPTNGAEGMDITYGEFKKQYLYFMKRYEIDDDESFENAATCKAQRQSIIENLISERIYLQKAKEMGLDELSAEARAAAEDDYNSQIEIQVKYYGKKALDAENSVSSDSSDTSDTSDTSQPSEEEIIARGNEELDKLLSECGMTREDMLEWNLNYLISTQLMDEVMKSVTREDAEKQYAEFLERVEALYNSDDSDFYFQGGYTELWLPEGSRRIKHVLLGFDEDTLGKISDLRKEGKDSEADAFREEKAAEFSDKIAEVNKALDDNISFEVILANYSADAAASSLYPDGYLVTPKDTQYAKEFLEAAFVPEKIGDRTVCTTDDGVHIIIYASDAVTDPETAKSVIDEFLGRMRSEIVEEKVKEWSDEYNYEIDYEKLRLDDPAVSDTSN